MIQWNASFNERDKSKILLLYLLKRLLDLAIISLRFQYFYKYFISSDY